MSLNLYEPIINKIESWIEYDANKPKSDNSEKCDRFRMQNDLDCALTGGNLNADTIFSLWLPLRFTLVRINGYNVLNAYGDISNKISFLRRIRKEEVLKKLLPMNNTTVQKLSALFEFGQQRCNVMILKNRGMQNKGSGPYYDYMPYFLYDCFDDGVFSKFFIGGNPELIRWISEEKLNMFFDGEISKDKIKDLSGSGDIKKGVPEDINFLLDNYINILEERKKLLGKH